MRLYWFQVAPNPTKVRLYVAEKNAAGAGIELEPVVVNLPRGEQNTADFRRLNPFASLPVLELDDGSTIVESLPIIDYLEELHPSPSLWGDDPRGRARARELERIADLRLMVPIARVIHATRSPLGLPPNPGVAVQAAAVWPQAMRFFDDLLSDGRPLLSGTQPCVADCTLAAALQFARFGEIDLGLDSRYPGVHQWDRTYRARDAVRDVFTL